MIAPVALLVLALVFGLGSLAAGLAEGVMLSVLIGAGAFALLLRAVVRRRAGRRDWIVVDGSNVMYWDGDAPRLDTVRAVTDDLRRRGLRPVIWFDANAGHLMLGRYAGPDRLARRLGLPARQVHVVPKGQPADPAIIAGAGRLGARIVTNDRYRDWQAANPALRLREVLVRGEVAAGVVRLGL